VKKLVANCGRVWPANAGGLVLLWSLSSVSANALTGNRKIQALEALQDTGRWR
jgi:hypothetical protein